MRSTTMFMSLLLAVALGACGGDSTGPTETNSGTYALRTVNGQSLPFLILQVGADRFEATGGSLVVTDNGSSGGTFISQLSLRSTVGGQVTTETNSDAGSYTRSGTAVVLTYTAEPDIWTGTMSGGRMAFTIAGEDGTFTLVYQK